MDCLKQWIAALDAALATRRMTAIGGGCPAPALFLAAATHLTTDTPQHVAAARQRQEQEALPASLAASHQRW